jgi:hypothetical protein
MIININNAMICYGHPVSILTEISNNMLRFTKGWLAVYNPSFVPGLFNLFVVFGQEILSDKMLFHSGHEPSPELKAQPGNRIKIFACLADLLHAALNGITKCRNYTMDMRMQAEVLSPGVQYAYCTAFSSIMTVTK